MASTNKRPVDWSITNLDTNEELLPPYPLDDDGVGFTVGGVYAEEQRFGFQDPLTQWTSGKLRTMRFTSVLFAQDSTDDITNEFERFIKLAEKDESLGRPPICVWNLGSFISEVVMVESVDPVIPPVRPEDGTPRRVTLNFTLRRYVPFSQKQIDPTKPTKESYFLIARRTEANYERIARTFYGDPMLGDRLRKRHPEEPFLPSVGAVVSIPPKSVILKETVEPEFHALSLTDPDAVASFEDILNERNKRVVVLVNS